VTESIGLMAVVPVGLETLLASALTTAVMVPSGQEYTDTPVHAFLNRNPR